MMMVIITGLNRGVNENASRVLITVLERRQFGQSEINIKVEGLEEANGD